MKKKQIIVFSGVVIKDNKILLTLRDEKECPAAHMKWEFPGGKVDFGETPQESLKREFLEETGIEITVKELLPYVQTSYWEYGWGKQQTICLVFVCEFVQQHTVNKDHHVADIKWFTFEEVANLETLPGTGEILDLVKKPRFPSPLRERLGEGEYVIIIS